MGKRKTYIIPVLIIWAIISFIFGFQFSYSQENGTGYFNIVIFAFILMILCGI